MTVLVKEDQFGSDSCLGSARRIEVVVAHFSFFACWLRKLRQANELFSQGHSVCLERDSPNLGPLIQLSGFREKCIKGQESAAKQMVQWESNRNNSYTTPASGSGGEQKEEFKRSILFFVIPSRDLITRSLFLKKIKL